MLNSETRVVVRKIRLRSSRRFSIGAFERSSTATIAASAASPAAPAPMMAGLAQPRTGAWLSAYRTSARPLPASRKPGMSSRPAAGSRCSARNSSPMRRAAVPNGTLTKKHHRQDSEVVSTPPSTGPTAGPRLRPSKTMPATRARRSRREGPEQHGLPDRDDQPAADALDDPEDDQLGQRAGQAAQRGGPGEQHQSGQEGTPGAEPVADPPRRRDHTASASR